MRTHITLAALVLGAALAGCGHEDDPCAGHSHDEACLVCHGDEDPVTPGSVKAGDGGTFSIEIVSADPSPLVNANNTLVVEVLDRGGQPVEGATFTKVEPFYPPGGHGTPITPTVTETLPGEYTITEVNFVHAGRWELRFDVEKDGATDHVVMTVCIEEAP